MKVLLIHNDKIRAESSIEKNTDDKILSKVLFNVQETQLKPILGKDLYKTVCDAVVAKMADSSYVIEAPYKDLLEDYIQPFLINATVAEFIAVNNYKITNKGVQKMNDNSSSSISAADLESVSNMYSNFSTSYKSNLIQFLKDNELVACGTGTDKNITMGITGWYLPK
jgi:hypothetical protein